MFTYNTFFTAILAIYRDTFSSTREYPVAYASLAVTTLLILGLVAGDFLLNRLGISVVQLPDQLSWLYIKPIQILLFGVLYLAQVVYYGHGSRWRQLLDTFDRMDANVRRRNKAIAIAVYVLVIGWFAIELILL